MKSLTSKTTEQILSDIHRAAVAPVLIGLLAYIVIMTNKGPAKYALQPTISAHSGVFVSAVLLAILSWLVPNRALRAVCALAGAGFFFWGVYSM